MPWSADDVQAGQALPELVVHELSRTDLVRYAGASGDFNPIHHDEEFAREAGNPTVFGHGMLTAAFVARCVTDAFGVESLRRFTVRFANRVWPGDTITCSGRITRVVDVAGVRQIEGEVEANTQRGDVAVRGTFVAALPLRR
jgi:peroxisomal enoyl-CoA hydratase 2